MKKLVLLLIPFLMLISCSEDEPVMEKWMSDALTVLDGNFYGELYSPITNTTEHENIKFRPFGKPKKYISLFTGDVIAYGTATIEKYVNDKSFYTESECVYNIRDYRNSDNEIILTFHEIDKTGNIVSDEDIRIINIISRESFEMRDYGLASETKKTYVKK